MREIDATNKTSETKLREVKTSSGRADQKNISPETMQIHCRAYGLLVAMAIGY